VEIRHRGRGEKPGLAKLARGRIPFAAGAAGKEYVEGAAAHVKEHGEGGEVSLRGGHVRRGVDVDGWRLSRKGGGVRFQLKIAAAGYRSRP